VKKLDAQKMREREREGDGDILERDKGALGCEDTKQIGKTG
jgi:hypothetical protein